VNLICLAIGASAQSVELTEDNFDDIVFKSGKSALISFHAPWCGACKAIKKDWEKLATEFNDKTDVVIADVDGTSDGGKQLRSRFGVREFPTIKYFHPPDDKLRSYKKAKDFEPFKKFADKLKQKCQINKIVSCSKNQKKALRPYLDMSIDDLEEKSTEMANELNATQAAFDAKQEELDYKFIESDDLKEKLEEMKEVEDEALEATQESYDSLQKVLETKFKESEDSEKELNLLKEEYVPLIALVQGVITAKREKAEEKERKKQKRKKDEL